MSRSRRVFSAALIISLVALVSGCGRHLSDRMPNLTSSKGSGSVDRSLLESVQLAIQEGRVSVVAEYLDAGFPVNQVLGTGNTPFLEAIVSTKGHLLEPMFALLKSRGADLEMRDAQGNSALKLAENRRAALRLLQPEKNAELLRQLFEQLSTIEERSEIVEIFKDQGEDVNVTHPDTGDTPLSLSIALKRTTLFAPLVIDLLEIVDLNKKNRDGRTPLSLAKELEWNRAVSKLVELGAKED